MSTGSQDPNAPRDILARAGRPGGGAGLTFGDPQRYTFVAEDLTDDASWYGGGGSCAKAVLEWTAERSGDLTLIAGTTHDDPGSGNEEWDLYLGNRPDVDYPSPGAGSGSLVAESNRFWSAYRPSGVDAPETSPLFSTRHVEAGETYTLVVVSWASDAVGKVIDLDGALTSLAPFGALDIAPPPPPTDFVYRVAYAGGALRAIPQPQHAPIGTGFGASYDSWADAGGELRAANAIITPPSYPQRWHADSGGTIEGARNGGEGPLGPGNHSDSQATVRGSLYDPDTLVQGAHADSNGSVNAGSSHADSQGQVQAGSGNHADSSGAIVRGTREGDLTGKAFFCHADAAGEIFPAYVGEDVYFSSARAGGVVNRGGGATADGEGALVFDAGQHARASAARVLGNAAAWAVHVYPGARTTGGPVDLQVYDGSGEPAHGPLLVPPESWHFLARVHGTIQAFGPSPGYIAAAWTIDGLARGAGADTPYDWLGDGPTITPLFVDDDASGWTIAVTNVVNGTHVELKITGTADVFGVTWLAALELDLIAPSG